MFFIYQIEHCDDEESFFELVSRFQSERMDDQRCSLAVPSGDNKENKNPAAPVQVPPVHNNGNHLESCVSF